MATGVVHEAERDFGGTGAASPPRRGDAEAWHDASGRGSGAARIAGLGGSLAQGGATWRCRGAAGKAASGAAAEAEPRAASAVNRPAAPRSAASWLSHRAVDTIARRAGHCATLVGELPPQPGVAHPRVAGLELPEAAVPGPRAGRAGDRALAALSLATHKKTRQNKVEACCCWTRRG